MAKKPAPPVFYICTCDRLPLASGDVLVRDQLTHLTPVEAKNYTAAGWVARV